MLGAMQLAEGKPRMLIDISMTIKPGSVFRLGTPAVEIASRRFYHESEGEYESTMISFSTHTATHVDLVFMEKRIDPRRMIGTGKLINVTQDFGELSRAVSGGGIRLDDVKHQVEIESRDFVFFRTDWSEFVGTMKYYDHPELSLEVVQWLVSKNINAGAYKTWGRVTNKDLGGFRKPIFRPKTAPNRRIWSSETPCKPPRSAPPPIRGCAQG
jgi:kynurenine formamidase